MESEGDEPYFIRRKLMSEDEKKRVGVLQAIKEFV